jgi:hypothetical protein
MPLHDAFTSLFERRWRWYAAHVERMGRMHLLKAPSLRINPDSVNIPHYITSEIAIDHHIRNMSGQPWFPSNIDDAYSHRYCQRPQRAETWVRADYVPPNPQRGVCLECWEAWSNLEQTETTPGRYFGSLTTSRNGEAGWFRYTTDYLTGH